MRHRTLWTYIDYNKHPLQQEQVFKNGFSNGVPSSNTNSYDTKKMYHHKRSMRIYYVYHFFSGCDVILHEECSQSEVNGVCPVTTDLTIPMVRYRDSNTMRCGRCI